MSDTTSSAPLPIASPREVRTQLGELSHGRRFALISTVIVLLLGAAAGLGTPLVLGAIVDTSLEGNGVADVLRLGALLAAAVVIGAVFTAAGVIALARLLSPMLATLREQMLNRTLHLPRATVERVGTGDIVSRATDDIAVISDAVSGVIPALTTALFTIALGGVGLALLDPAYAFAFVAIIPMHVFAVRRYLKKAPPLFRAEREAVALRADRLLGSMRGIDTVMAFGLAPVHARRISAASWQVVKLSMRAIAVQNRFYARLNAAEFLGMGTILVIGFLLVNAGFGTIGGATAAMLLFLRLFSPIGQLLSVIDDLQAAAASLERVVGIIRLPTEPVEVAITEPTTGAARHGALLSAVGLGFEYSAGRQVLADASFRIYPQETIAVVGASGAGKSTLAAVIAGVHLPTAGHLDVAAGVSIAVVTQEVHTFAGRLRDDLTLARAEATDDELHRALRVVLADGWVHALPEGIDTIVGAHGHQLTPAQAQQLALARVVLADPQIAILDEATAESASGSSRLLEAASANACAGRAAIIIAHRLDNAMRADRILVMDAGRIVEQGTHSQLLAANAGYAALWQSWSVGREAD